MDMHYSIEQIDDAQLRVRLSGELDLNTADELADILLGAIGRHDATAVEVDLAGVKFMDSSALAALAAGLKASAQAGCAFYVSHPHDTVRKVLDIAGLLAPLSRPVPG